MGMTTKPQRDAETLRAIEAYLELGGRVKIRNADTKSLRHAAKFGSRGKGFVQTITMGFNEKVLRD